MKQETFRSFDGASLGYRVAGEGPPVVMLHGFLANARFNWIDPGITGAIVDAGFQAIMLDLRGHGLSAQPDGAAFPPDVLAMDGAALITHLGLGGYDLVGYSLGARTAVRMLARGARPRRCVLGGMGLSAIVGSAQRVAFFRDAIVNGDKARNPQAAKVINAMIANAQLKPAAMLAVLEAQLQTTETELDEIETPILVVSGADDDDNGSAEELASTLPHARAARVPGNHLSTVQAPELAAAIVDFLRSP
ncbi:MAG: alpha/beta hydrolase [Terricaulis sp.]